jgi:Chaperone of endosialidase
MDESNRNIDSALDGIDADRRANLRRMVLKGAFVTPIVASFAMAGLTIDAAAQCAPNTTCTASGRPVTPSDRRLKTDVVRIGAHALGFGIYRFKYLWSEEEYIGVLAQEVAEVLPSAVVRQPNSFFAVDYAAIGMAMRSAGQDSAAPPA